MIAPNQQPAPSGLGAVLSIVQAVVAIVPRWLVVAAGVIFVSWLGFDLYQNSEQKALQTETMRAQKAKVEAEAVEAAAKAHAASSSPRF